MRSILPTEELLFLRGFLYAPLTVRKAICKRLVIAAAVNNP